MIEIKRPLIIEFNGLPGSGKTTVSNELLKLLKNKGYNVTTLEDIIIDLNISKYKKYIQLLKYGGIKLPISLLLFFLSIKPLKLYRLNHIKKIYLFYFIYQRLTKRSQYDLVIVDQGIIQAIISSLHLDEIKNKRYFKKLICSLLRDNHNYLLVDCLSNEQISHKRINTRKKNQGRFDKMDINKMVTNLEVQNEIIKEIRKYVNIYSVERVELNMQDSPKDNSNILYSEITVRIK